MRPGIFAKTFPAGSLEESLDLVVGTGIRAIQFNLALAGGRTLPEEVPPELAARVYAAVTGRGLEMVAVSGTCNLAHPEPRVRAVGIEALSALIAAAPRLGTRVVTLCTGSRDREDMWRWHPDNASPAAWADMVESVARATAVAERHGVVLAFEPEHGNVVSDAARARQLLDEIGSAHLRVVIDAANLIGPGGLGDQSETLRRAFELLGRDLALAHAKDVREDGTATAAGRGGLDWDLYVTLLRQVGYRGAIVLHGLTATQVPDSLSFLEAKLGAALSEPA